MPRYFFHLVSPEQFLHDPEGVEASGDEAACAGVLDVVAELRGDPDLLATWREWSIQIVEASGRKVVTIPMATMHQ